MNDALEPTLVAGMTTDELVTAMPALIAELTDRIDEQARCWQDWSLRWLRAWNAQDLDAVLGLVTADVVYEDPSMFGTPIIGRDAFREFVTMTWRAFPDVRFEIAGPPYLSMIGSGLAVPWRARGTFLGDMAGGPTPLGLAPTGARFDTRGVDRYELRDGLMCRWVTTFDQVDLAGQTGLLPGPRTLLFRFVIRLQRLAAPLLRLRARSGRGG